MPKRSSKRKARIDSPTSSVVEPEAASQRTEKIPSISYKHVSENFERVEKSDGKRIRETEMRQREFLKIIKNWPSKVDSLSRREPENVNSETDEISLENIASTSRTTRINQMTEDESHYTCSHYLNESAATRSD